jgi:predicted permease
MRWEHWIYTIPLRLRSLFRRNRVEQELDDELQFHLEALTDQHLRAGMDADAARQAALRAMQGIELRKEQGRDTRRVQAIDHLAQDLRYALRGMRRHPAFSAMAVLTLALGIGATTAILGVINAVLLRPLPFPDPDRLIVINATTPARGVLRDTTSFPDFLDWKNQSRSFTDIAAWRIDEFNLTGDAPPERVVGLRTTQELFNVMGIQPILGRMFDAQEQREQRTVAVISHAVWMRRFGGDANVLGRIVRVNEVPHTIVGVLPQGFQFPAFNDIDIIAPIPMRPSRGIGYLRGVARLAPGVTRAGAQQELDTIAARLEQVYPESNRGRGLNAMPLQDVAISGVRTPLLVLIGAAIFVLLIGCANVGNLILARGLTRQRELAMRSALGAGTGRLVRQMLTESVLLALIAALLGTVFAFWGSSLLMTSLSSPRFVLPPIAFDWSTWRLLAVAIGLALASGVLCALPPVLMVRSVDLNDVLKSTGGRGAAGAGAGVGSGLGSFTTRGMRDVLVISQTALTIMLLVGAGLLLKSFVLLQRVEIGFDPQNLLMADLLLSQRHAPPPQREVYLTQLLDSIASLPGVQHVAVLTDRPLDGGSTETFNVEGHADPTARTGHPADFNIVSAAYFATIGTAITRGREFDTRDDANGMPVAIINEAMARRFWPNADPIGKRIHFYYDKDPQHWLTIVGVAANVRQRGIASETRAQVFIPYRQPGDKMREPYVSLAVRTAGDPATMMAGVRARIWAVDKDQPISNMMPMTQFYAESIGTQRIYLLLLGIFAAIALVMATAGIYGVSAYAVARRTQEMGIRIALGATRAQILALVVRHSLVLTLLGVAIGIAGAIALKRIIAGFLFGITPTDVTTFVAMGALFVGVALVATLIPARRAASIDPAVAFRYE